MTQNSLSLSLRVSLPFHQFYTEKWRFESSLINLVRFYCCSERSIAAATAAVYYFDAATRNWKNVDGGLSQVNIYENPANGTYRVVAMSAKQPGTVRCGSRGFLFALPSEICALSVSRTFQINNASHLIADSYQFCHLCRPGVPARIGVVSSVG